MGSCHTQRQAFFLSDFLLRSSSSQYLQLTGEAGREFPGYEERLMEV